jgi:5-dehydro-2-deoxygluconokinase
VSILPKRILENNFLVLGRAGLDLYADPPGKKLEEALSFTAALGGSAANIAAAITRLGGKAALISTLSDDAVARHIYRQLKHYEIDAHYVSIAKGEARSSLAVVETRNENCQSVIYRNGAADFQLQDSEISKIPFQDYSALIVTGTALAMEPSRSSTLNAMQLAKQAQLAVILDVDYRPYSWSSEIEAANICSQAVELSDFIVGNDVEFSVLATGNDGKKLAETIADSNSKTVIYKMGEKGSITFDSSVSFTTPIFKVSALKSTGAGDAFMGGLVTSLAADFDLETSVKRGSASAAIVVTKVGCAPAMPTLSELELFLLSAVN